MEARMEVCSVVRSVLGRVRDGSFGMEEEVVGLSCKGQGVLVLMSLGWSVGVSQRKDEKGKKEEKVQE